MRERPLHLPSKLKTIRQRLGVSQTGMKRVLDFKGHYGRISEYELGRRQPTVLVLLSYARAAKIPLEHIVDDRIELKF